MGKTAVQSTPAQQETPQPVQAGNGEATTWIKSTSPTSEQVQFEQPNGLPSDNGSTPETVATDEKPAVEAKTFTQDDLNKILAARLDQERKKYADYDALKAELEGLKQPKTAETGQNERFSALEAQAKDLAKRNQELTMQAAIVKQASAIGLDVTAAAKLVDSSKLTIGEDGSVTGLEEAVKAVAEQYPGLVARQFPRTQPVNPGRGGDPNVRTDADRRREYFNVGTNPFWSGGGVIMNDE